ncbi:MAG: amino acid adenylation domain-containing protein [Rhizonema sp. PD37]|nr:amino acid adenylation domain-containing protein [Rhizonema sp. PD37]
MNGIVKTTYSPLSYSQKAMWFIYQIAPESVAYNIFITVKINSDLNIAAVIRVWSKIFAHHPILRTIYTTHDSEPVQLLKEEQKFIIQVTDASNWSEDYLQEKIFAETDRPFNLEKESVLRVNLFTLSVKEHILLLTMHHIAGDLWSFDLLLSEFQALYTIEIEQDNQEQIEAALYSSYKKKTYVDFVHWQSEMLSSPRGEKLWQYWQKQLAGELQILNLLADKPRPLLRTYQGETHILKLDEQLIKKLKNLASAFGKTLYQVLLTAFYVQLYRYTNQKDILIGSPMRGRWGGDFREIIGYFVNLVVLRTSVRENATFAEFLAQVSNIVKEAQKHQYYPFSLLVEKLQQQQDSSRSPLCQVSFTWQPQRWCESKENSLNSQEQVLQMEPYLLGHQRGADFDLNLMVMEAESVFQLCWQYNTDLFESTTIERMALHFVTLLEAIVANPDWQISKLPLLTATEQHQLLVTWNNQKTEFPDKCIHQLFEEQVELSPDAIALVFEDEQLTYRELNRRANQLAHYLQQLGVKPEVLVGICIERSLSMIVGILGILKAGGAYVPLDPAYPQERLAFMLSDAQVSVLLTQPHLVKKLPESKAQYVCLDTEWHFISQSSEENPITLRVRQFQLDGNRPSGSPVPHRDGNRQDGGWSHQDLNCLTNVQATNLAYVIYTSGSTGQPKGVLVAHRNLVHSTCARISYYLEPVRRFLLVSSLAFDTSVAGIFWTLCCGGTLVLPQEGLQREIPKLVKLIHQNHISHLLSLPSLYALIIQQAKREQLASLHTIIVAGESCLSDLVKQHQEYLPSASLFNEYGPTEGTVWSSVYLCQFQELTRVPIGRPIANTQIYILDSKLRPVPVGIAGELHISGAGVARGYLNRPELTLEKFIPNPFSDDPLARLYKTGDKTRCLPNGNIEYIGRIDHQVKIRGYRIELGEIEVLLSQHSKVQQVVVVVRSDHPDDKYLTAYVVPVQTTKASFQESAPTIADLRHFLKQKLPDYMIPSVYVILDSLPLTPNGKVDRQALPTTEGLRLDKEAEYVAPRTLVEEMLAKIWAEVLSVEKLGIDDNFFDLGGHSLKATRVLSRVQEAFQVELPLHSLFEEPTIAKFSQVIEKIKHNNAVQASVIKPVSREKHRFRRK